MIFVFTADAATLSVPGDYATVQEAAEASARGDIIEVTAAGDYELATPAPPRRSGFGQRSRIRLMSSW